MRTVTFSSAPVQRTLNEQFVCGLINTKGDPSAGMSMAHAPKDSPGPCSRGIGHQNVQCLFLTPKGEIFHAASGYIGPEDMEKELEFVLKTYESVKKSPSPAKAKELVSDVHLKRAKELGFTDAEIRQPRGLGGFDALFFMGAPNSPDKPFNRSAQASRGRQPAVNNNAQGFPFANFGFGQGEGNPFDMSSIFEFKTKQTVLNDHKFSIEHPLMPMKELLKEPRVLVGHEKTAFSSTGNGMPSGGLIGK